jgi:hypothetical protein
MQDGELLKVGTRRYREDAEKFVEALNQWWPAEYTIQETLVYSGPTSSTQRRDQYVNRSR